MIELHASRAKTNGVWIPAHGRVVASLTFPEAATVRRGQTIQLFGILSRPEQRFAPGLFDYRAHLANRGIHFVFRSEHPSDLVIHKDEAATLIRVVRLYF